ncbi:GIY-YIG nuclease family protein [Ornithinibacillus sp. JPR2-1]|uniref:GIY-YIG nuclease family protein n=1 Tax=Bacillaceae TaxID=186817 RepID=UPI0031E3590F
MASKCGVYFFQETKGGLVKIGKSNDWDRRLQVINTGPYEVVKLHTIETDNPLIVERHFKRYFKDKGVRGEWHCLSEGDINWIRAGQYPINIQLSIIGEEYKMKLLKKHRWLFEEIEKDEKKRDSF